MTEELLIKPPKGAFFSSLLEGQFSRELEVPFYVKIILLAPGYLRVLEANNVHLMLWDRDFARVNANFYDYGLAFDDLLPAGTYFLSALRRGDIGWFEGELVSVACGNGVLEPEESCDDGNKLAGDRCNAICGGP